MPKMYVANDGKGFYADTPEELVEEMRKDSFTITDNNEQYMQETAKRVKRTLDIVISTESAAEFVAGLLQAGLLVEGNS